MTVLDTLLEETAHRWEAEIQLANGDEFALNNWLPITLTGNFDGWSMEFTTADLDQAARITPLITDVVLLRDDVVFERFRVLDDTDNFTPDGHTVTFQCATYEAILARRILHDDWNGKAGTQHDLAYDLIRHTEGFAALRLDRLPMLFAPLTPSANRTRTIKKGVTIAAALDDLASVDGGFDWWFETQPNGDPIFHVQTPRRTRAIPRDLGWGQGFTEIVRDSAAETYSSRVMTLGSQQEVVIPGGGPGGADRTYPPPPAQVMKVDPMPYGLWEASFNYADVLTVATLQDRAKWNLAEATALRPTYNSTFEPGLWTPDIKIGDVFTLIIDSPPRIVEDNDVRVEELQIQIEPDGSEIVNAMLRAEEEPAVIAALATPAGLNGTVVATTPSGRSTQPRRIAASSEFGRMLQGLRGRISRTERSGWS